MAQSAKRSTFKHHTELRYFFGSDHIKLHNVREYLKERGIFAFADTKESISNFACNFYIGFDSQESLKKYIDVKAFPKISGLIIIPEKDISLEVLRDYLDTHTGQNFQKYDSTFVNLTEEYGALFGKIRYTLRDYSLSYNMFNTETQEVIFKISKEENLLILKLVQKRDSDYSVTYDVINNIILKDKSLNLKLLENDLSKIPTTTNRHKFFKMLLEELDEKHKFIGAIKFGRNKAKDLGSKDSFEEKYRRGSQEIEATDLNTLITEIENRGAYLDELDLVLYDKEKKQLFILKILCRDNKKRLEIGLSSDIKKIEESKQLDDSKSRDKINELDSVNLNDEEKLDIIMDMWNIIARNFYISWEDLINNSRKI